MSTFYCAVGFCTKHKYNSVIVNIILFFFLLLLFLGYRPQYVQILNGGAFTAC